MQISVRNQSQEQRNDKSGLGNALVAGRAETEYMVIAAAQDGRALASRARRLVVPVYVYLHPGLLTKLRD